MAGAFSAENKAYLEKHTDGAVGKTELYLAHFMGASGATKLLNNRDDDGNTIAASLFPKEAHANKNVFFDPANGQPRTLNDIYDFFAHKFNTGTTEPSASARTQAETGSIPPAPAQTFAPSALDSMFYMQGMTAQALSSSDGIIWNDEQQDSRSGFSHSGTQKLSGENILIMAQMHQHIAREKPVYNS
jgi:hypothetical protein